MKINMQPTRTPMAVRDPAERIHTFEEVALGYTPDQAVNEAMRCLNCPTMPCVGACPVRIHIPQFIAAIKEGDFEKAYQIIAQTSTLPAVCGRVCPQEKQCESKCTRGAKGESVGIGYLERFVADWHNEHTRPQPVDITPNGIKVAVIGSGPSALTCAGDLAKKGYAVTIFEALHIAGGVLVFGIPEFRLPKRIVAREIENLLAMGVKIETNVVIGKTLDIADLREMGYRGIFVGTGAGLPRFLGIPGENASGVYSANEFLTRVNLMKAYTPGSNTPIPHPHKAIVVGGGNVAMDAARSVRRIGAEVTVVYRRGEAELPARRAEVVAAKEEGINFCLLCNPTAILTDDKGTVTGVECVEMTLGEPDASGRRSPVENPDKRFTLEADTVIVAIGTTANPLLRDSTSGLDYSRKGGIIIDESTGMTSMRGVFAGGDAVTGAATVILAMGAGKLAAEGIDNYLQNRE